MRPNQTSFSLVYQVTKYLHPLSYSVPISMPPFMNWLASHGKCLLWQTHLAYPCSWTWFTIFNLKWILIWNKLISRQIKAIKLFFPISPKQIIILYSLKSTANQSQEWISKAFSTKKKDYHLMMNICKF